MCIRDSCKEANYLAAGHIIQRGARAGGDYGTAYDKQRNRIGNGNSRACGADHDLAGDDTDGTPHDGID